MFLAEKHSIVDDVGTDHHRHADRMRVVRACLPFTSHVPYRLILEARYPVDSFEVSARTPRDYSGLLLNSVNLSVLDFTRFFRVNPHILSVFRSPHGFSWGLLNTQDLGFLDLGSHIYGSIWYRVPYLESYTHIKFSFYGLAFGR